MIYCIIDGEKAYPSLSSNIKITRENPELKDKGSYTLDVTFPMSIYENQVKFRHLNRIDVALRKNHFDSVRLMAGCVPVISGIGVVTSISNKEVKLQIMNANSEFKYASGFEDKYIDEMFKWWNCTIAGMPLPANPPTIDPTNILDFYMPKMIDYDKALQTQSHVGDASIGIYTPVYDETNDRIVNEIAKLDGDGRLIMACPQVQPNLLYIMKTALEYMGYTADLSVIDKYPWNRIYIVNTGNLLPHWTLERFITEFKSLFGLSLRIEGKNAVFCTIDYDSSAVSYECLDEFTSEYDEEGLQVNATGNLRYNLYDSPNKTAYTEISDEIMNAFGTLEYVDEAQMWAEFTFLTDKQRAMSVFVTPTGYFYARVERIADTGPIYTLERAGQFNKLVRDKDNDSTEDINIVPVTMACMDVKFRKLALDGNGLILNGEFKVTDEKDISIIMPTAENDGNADNGQTTVEQALESGDTENVTRSESERMEVFFLGTGTKSFTALDKTVTMAAVGTDPSIDRDFKDNISFALDRAHEGYLYVGQFHARKSRIDGKNQRCIKFLCDCIPDPTSIYIFNNKRYVCEKIEIQLTDRGIDQVKTGYFYEITS